MKKNEIKVGRHYTAKVSGNLVTVRVDAIRETMTYRSSKFGKAKPTDTVVYDVTNLATGRKTTFRSAQKFRSEAKPADFSRVREVTGKKVTQADIPKEATSPLASLLQASIAKIHHDNAPHLIVEARAGTGKTTTLVEGLKRVKGLPVSIEPSPQQAAVWEQMELSRGAQSICFVAFNRSIAEELKRRVPPGCEAMTMHGLGYRALTKALGRQEPSDWAVQDLIAEVMGRDVRELRREKLTVLKATEELVCLCKQNLVGHGWSEGGDKWSDELARLADHYQVDLNGSRAEVFALVPHVLERCKEPNGKFSYDDMIWLPIVLNLPLPSYDLLLVDEAQDLNRCQQALAKRAGKRLILCGDPKQAIYGFAGADAESMKRMVRELGKRLVETERLHGEVVRQEIVERGCITLPLTVTRRCGRAIVEEAKRYVPDFEAHESNGPGRVIQALFTGSENGQENRSVLMSYQSLVEAGDMILCRVNAPLVKECFWFIRQGRKANIQGRDVGKGLTAAVAKLKALLVGELITKITDWLHSETAKENAKRNPSENRITAIQDKADCLVCFTEGLKPDDSVDLVLQKIASVFTDDKVCPGIRLSSVHKAKGLEARRVFILQPKGVGPRQDKMKAWELEQENNLRYVAITRAIEELVYVS